MRWKTREDGSVAVSLLLEWNAIASVAPSEMSPLHPLEIPLARRLLFLDNFGAGFTKYARASEGRARVDPHFFSGGRGECQPASSAPSPAPISPAGISSRCASGFTLTSRGTLARSLSIGATVFWQTLTVRARSGVGDAHAELLMLPKMSVTYDRRGLEIHYQFRSD